MRNILTHAPRLRVKRCAGIGQLNAIASVACVFLLIKKAHRAKCYQRVYIAIAIRYGLIANAEADTKRRLIHRACRCAAKTKAKTKKTQTSHPIP
ncbi:hypothetical protein CAI21_21880, partial [Alkalilimnicola ehrlichii]